MIRAEVLKILPKILGTEACPKLTEALSDQKWWVRLQAALALKKLGEDGQNILLKQIKENKNAFDVAQYVLSLP